MKFEINVIRRIRCLYVILLISSYSVQSKKLFKDEFESDSSRGVYKNAAVAADNGVCSDIGKDILKQGGNAVESVIATAICIGVMDPHSSGLGGGHFLTVYTKKTKNCTIFDARERAPFSSTEEIYRNDSVLSKQGWKSIAVPGEVHGFWTAYQSFGGQVPWKNLWTPTIKLCRNGFHVSPALAKAISETKSILENVTDFDLFKNPYTNRYYKTKDTMKRLKLADTMEQIANSEDPVKLFYKSDWTKSMVEEIQKKGGLITLADMESYETRHGDSQRPPVYTKLQNDLVVCGPPPPSSAGVTASILNVLDGYNFHPTDSHHPKNVTNFFHKFVESMKFAYGVRYELGDIDYLPAARHRLEAANFKAYGELIRQRIGDISNDDPYFYGPHTLKWDSGTAHMVVVDEQGNAASLTSSINMYFGAKVVSQITDIIYNNQMDDFSIRSFANYFQIEPSPANKLLPGKRPMSSMSPLIVFNNLSADVKLAIGAAGGVKIISATAQAAMRVMYFNQTIKEAIDAGRVHNQLLPNVTYYETGFPQEILDSLENNYKQSISPNISSFGSVVVGIHRTPDGHLEANSDFRKGGGYPAGY